MPNIPGVQVTYQDAVTSTTAADAELPLMIVGPLYHVVEKEESDTSFPIRIPGSDADVTFTWPGKKVGSVVDLNSINNGLIDSQRKPLADFAPEVYLVDGASEYQVDDEHIINIDQTGFHLEAEAADGLDRGTFSVWAISLNNEEVIYLPTGGLNALEVGDVFDLSGTSATISEVTSDTQISVSEDISGATSSKTRVAQDEAASEDVSVSVDSTAGRVVVAVTTTDFLTEEPSLAVGDVAVTGVPMSGFTSLEGQIVASTDGVDGITFNRDIALSEVENYIVKVVSYDTDATYTTVDQTYFDTISDIDTSAGTLDFSGAIAGLADNDYVKITILEAQLGYIEAINATNDQITVVVPNTFSDTRAFVDLYPDTTDIDVYPDFDVQVSFRALRADLADSVSSVETLQDFLDEVDHDSVDSNDVLGWAMSIGFSSQESNVPIYYCPVDLEPDGTTGLPANRDYNTGYSNALEAVEAPDVHNIVALDVSRSDVSALVKSHVDAMSTAEENQYRRGFFINEVPLGSTNSEDGIIEAGKVTGGIAASATDGNKVIRDAGVDFVTGAGVVAGTEVVVTFPEEYAGTYTALGTTTDNDLILDGDDWDITKEFSATPLDLNTPSTGTHVLSGASAGLYSHVEAGDYVELTESGNIYRLLVSSVNGAGDEITMTDEVPGDLDFGTGNSGNATNTSVIRTWDTVKYYIDPLTKSQQVTELANSKTLASELYSVGLDWDPTMVTGTDNSGDPIEEVLRPEYTLVAIAAKRSGAPAYEEATNKEVGGGITSVKWGYGTFRKSQLKTLSDAGFMLVTQKTASANPIILDMITSLTTDGITKQEEVVVSGSHWIGKALTDQFANAPGSGTALLTPELIGRRAVQLYGLIKSWVSEGRIIDGRIITLEQNDSNPRKLDVELELTFAVGEKEISITITRTV